MTEMRVQRALAQAGVASRRAAERLIQDGKVRVDGRLVGLGDKVDPATQRITVGRRVVTVQSRRWLAFHKPLGVVTTANDERGRPTVFDYLREPAGLAYVGRLDVMTTGLLLLTNDGEALHRLTHPRYRIPRRYSVLVHGADATALQNQVGRRIVIEGRPVVPTRVRVRAGRQGRSIIDVTLTEGRNRIVRRWCEAMGTKVERLARLSYGPIVLGKLPVGEARPLEPREEVALYRAVRLDIPADLKQGSRGARRSRNAT
jgi:23S rRNA pseudouridine2605 synthase